MWTLIFSLIQGYKSIIWMRPVITKVSERHNRWNCTTQAILKRFVLIWRIKATAKKGKREEKDFVHLLLSYQPLVTLQPQAAWPASPLNSALPSRTETSTTEIMSADVIIQPLWESWWERRWTALETLFSGWWTEVCVIFCHFDLAHKLKIPSDLFQ